MQIRLSQARITLEFYRMSQGPYSSNEVFFNYFNHYDNTERLFLHKFPWSTPDYHTAGEHYQSDDD